MMDLLSKVFLAIIGTGILGELLIYRFKRRDSISDRDKELLNPIIDEVCRICYCADKIIVKSNRVSKRLDELHKQQLKLFEDADVEMHQYNILQNELMGIFSKGRVSSSDLINLPIIQKQSDRYAHKRSEIMEEALAIPKEEKKIITEFNIEIQKEISPYIGLTHRLTNIYKISNKKTSSILCQQLTKIDHALKEIITSCESYPTLLLSPPHLFYLFKVATNCRLKLAQLNAK